MLPKQYRLPLRTELKRVQKKGKIIHGPLFSLLVSRRPSGVDHYRGDSGCSRFAFIISSKVHKRAVKRNRMKRLLSEAIEDLLSELEPGFDGVFLAKKAMVGRTFGEIKREVEIIFRQGGLISQKRDATSG